jgi:hypothetical protein
MKNKIIYMNSTNDVDKYYINENSESLLIGISKTNKKWWQFWKNQVITEYRTNDLI